MKKENNLGIWGAFDTRLNSRKVSKEERQKFEDEKSEYLDKLRRSYKPEDYEELEDEPKEEASSKFKNLLALLRKK